MSQVLPCTIQLRNNVLVQYYDTSYLDFKRGGHTATLKQNQKSKIKEKIKELNKVKEVENINDFEKKYKKVYDKHKQSLASKNVELKDFGILSNAQKKTLKKNVENLINLVTINYDRKKIVKNQKFIAFVTLTLPSSQKHTDTVLRKSLVRFIENLTKTYKVQHYVWKAETQKNGNIHFHLLIDRFIDWQVIKSLWNKQLFKLGYIDFYQKKMKSFFREGFKLLPNDKRKKEQQIKAYESNLASNFTTPNTTDIHSLKGVSNITNYIIKYMTKLEPNKRSIIGAVWGANNELKKINYPTVTDFDFNGLFTDLINLVENEKQIKVIPQTVDFVSLFVGKIYKYIRKKYKNLWLHIKSHYNLQLQKSLIPFKDIVKNIRSIVKPLNIVFPTYEQTVFNFN